MFHLMENFRLQFYEVKIDNELKYQCRSHKMNQSYNYLTFVKTDDVDNINKQ